MEDFVMALIGLVVAGAAALYVWFNAQYLGRKIDGEDEARFKRAAWSAASLLLKRYGVDAEKHIETVGVGYIKATNPATWNSLPSPELAAPIHIQDALEKQRAEQDGA